MTSDVATATNANPLPEKGQTVHVLAVRDLSSWLIACSVVRRDEMLVTLRTLDQDALTSRPLADDARVRVVYTEAGLVCHTAGTVEESIEDDGLLQIELDDAPVRQERREFVRAELPLDLNARPLHGAPDPPSLPASDDPGWRAGVPVNLSGSGVRFPMSTPCEADDLLLVAMRLPTTTNATIQARGRVVRLVETESGVPEVAVQFLDLTPAQEDELINLALKVRFDELG